MTGRTLAHYTTTGQIGAGGMGVVWKACDTKLQRDVAIKTLPVQPEREGVRQPTGSKPEQLAVSESSGRPHLPVRRHYQCRRRAGAGLEFEQYQQRLFRVGAVSGHDTDPIAWREQALRAHGRRQRHLQRRHAEPVARPRPRSGCWHGVGLRHDRLAAQQLGDESAESAGRRDEIISRVIK